jgi:putative membrane protein
MIIDALTAYAHFISIFLAFSCLTAELILYRPSMPAEIVRRLRRVDAGYGLAAAAIIGTGFLRFSFSGKGADFYVHSGVFWIKMTLVAAVVLVSVVPTAHFLRLPRRGAGGTVAVAHGEFRRTRAFLWTEATLLALIPLFAALMARGVGLR